MMSPTLLRVVVSATVLIAGSRTLTAVEIPEPTNVPDRLVVELDSPWVNMTTGGAGRYIVFHLREAGKLALLDVSAGGVSAMIDAPGEDVMLAAGLEKLMVLVPSQNILHRYDLATLKREKSFPTPTGFKPVRMHLGSASQGPLVCHDKGPISLFDIERFKPITIRGDVLSSGTFGDWGYSLTVSGDGQTIVGWIPGISGQQFHVMRLSGNSAAISKTADGFSDAGRYFKPNADGSLFFRNGAGLFSADLKPLPADHLSGHVLLPSDDARYFLALKPSEDRKKADAWICGSGTLQKIAAVREVGHVIEGRLGAEFGHWRTAPRVRWLPTASTLVSLPVNNKEVLLARANLKELLDAEGGEYLHITSTPPRSAFVGQPYVYQVEVVSSRDEVKFQAETAPEGFAISDQGEVRWTPREKPIGGVERVIIAISAGDEEVFHSFEISVERPVGRVAGVVPRPGRPAEESPASPPPDRGAAAPSAGREPVKIGEDRLEVPSGPFLVAPGESFRRHLLLQGDRLTVLKADGVTPEKTVTLGKPYVRIAERDGYYVAVAKDPVVVEQLDKKTLQVAKSVRFHAMEITNLALHPTRPLAYVAYKHDVEFPRYRFLVYDESRGEGRESDDYLGTFLEVDPEGDFLIAGYRDIYEKGANFIFNPDRIHVVPDYGSVDWLLRYDLDERGLPKLAEMREEAGGNGRGIRLSRDGKRVSYLSVVGSPPFSRCLCAWDTRDFKKIPTTFPINDKASTEALAYHPFLPWVACKGRDGSPLFFDRESGEPIPERAAPLDLGSAQVHGLWFAADGRSVVLDTSVNGIHYLHRAPLKLSAEETRACEAAYEELGGDRVIRASLPSLKTETLKVPLASLHALQGGAGKSMTAKDVARWFTDAVVVVKTPDGNGTGMLVGADGYVLTCAHCVSGADLIEVSYRRPSQGQIRSVTTKAKLLRIEEERDLALLKIRVPFPLRTVRFGASGDLASGERVYVIGNPGVNTTILDYTITEGIVSSPSRKLGDWSYIQTSAQVNPGSSGGPLFNERGLVVGQVVLKATIEGAGFATPSDQIISFLVRHVDLAEGLRLRRDWIDSTGAYRINATLEEITGDSIKVRKSDGAELAVPLDRLSKPDKTFVDLLRRRLPP